MNTSNRREKVAFVAHPVDVTIFKSYVGLLRPDKTYCDALLIKLFEWTQPYLVKQFSALSFSPAQNPVDADLFMVPFLPEMQEISIKKVVDKIENTLALASAGGCTVAALGGFTSIVLQNSEEKYVKKYGIRITSGNTLTAAIIIRSLESIAERFTVDLSSVTLAIIGASGDIGSACLGYFSSRVKKMVLTARSLPALAEVCKRHGGAKATAALEMTDDNQKAVQMADICIFVTSAYTSLFNEKDFKPGTIVCDASAPVNVKIESSVRDDVFIYHGGIASTPFALEVDFNIGLASPYTFYGCQLEGLLLALNPELPCSWGRGNITSEKLSHYLRTIDTIHTLTPAYTIDNRVYSEDQLLHYEQLFRTKPWVRAASYCFDN